jgi:membrane protease YdiL (CAAX protease family)
MCALQQDSDFSSGAVKELNRTTLPSLKFWPVIATLGLLVFAFMVEAVAIALAMGFVGNHDIQSSDDLATLPWTVRYVGHTGMLVFALLCIAFLSHNRFREFGFRLPPNARYIRIALLFGIAFGIMMTAAAYANNLVNHVPPDHFSLSPTDVAGRLTFIGLYGSTGEEILFRGLLLTFLTRRMSGRIRVGKFDLHIGGVIVAVLFSLAHLTSFWTESFSTAAAQQGYGIVAGITYANWYEKSGSLLPSIVGHNVGNFVEELCAFLMAWRWS